MMKKTLFLLLFMIPLIGFSQDIFWEQIRPISAQVEISNPDTSDIFLIQDVFDSNRKKYIKLGAIINSASNSLGIDTLFISDFKIYIVQGTDTLISNSLPTLLTQLDSAGFTLTESQIVGLNYFTNADETDQTNYLTFC